MVIMMMMNMNYYCLLFILYYDELEDELHCILLCIYGRNKFENELEYELYGLLCFYGENNI